MAVINYRKNWSNEKLISRLVNNKSKKTYWANISELRSRPNLDVFNKSIKLIESKKTNEKIIGIDILAQLGVSPRPFEKQTINKLFELLKYESNDKVLGSLLYAIGHNNDNLNKSQISALYSLKNNKNSWVKEGLVFSILGINNQKAIELSIFFSKDRLSNIRNWSTFNLGSLIEKDNNQIRNALLDRIKDKHQETKLEALVGLAKRQDLRVLEPIKKELLKGEFSTLIFEAIIELNDKQFLSILKENLRISKRDKTINKEWIIDLINCIKTLEGKKI